MNQGNSDLAGDVSRKESKVKRAFSLERNMKRPLKWAKCESWTVADHFLIRKGRKYPKKHKKDELLISGDKREENSILSICDSERVF